MLAKLAVAADGAGAVVVELAALRPKTHPIAARSLDHGLDAVVVRAQRAHRTLGEIGFVAVEVALPRQTAQQPRGHEPSHVFGLVSRHVSDSSIREPHSPPPCLWRCR